MTENSREAPKFQFNDSQFTGVIAEENQGNIRGGDIHNRPPERKQNLADAAAEIHQLLQKLDQTYSTNTQQGQEIVVQEARKRIQSNPTLKARVRGALQSSGVEAFKQAVNHPLIHIVLEGWKGWQEAE